MPATARAHIRSGSNWGAPERDAYVHDNLFLDRDAVDRRLVAEARTGGGKIIDSENEVGGYAVLGRVP